MLGSAVIVFREVLEASLIIGILMAALRGIPRRLTFGSGGVLLGVAGAGIVAAFADTLFMAFEGSGQEVFNAAVLLTAVVMLGWHTVWMARHGRELAAKAKALGDKVHGGEATLWAVLIAIAVAVLREGSEVVLFLGGIIASSSGDAASTLAGGAVGLGAGIVAGGLLYAGLVRIPMSYFWSATNLLIILLAAGLGAQAVGFLAQAGLVTQGSTTLWDTAAWLPEASAVGTLLHTLIGYMERPSHAQGLVYAAIVAALILAGQVVQRRAPQSAASPTG
jgi:high-affinity iron transporter